MPETEPPLAELRTAADAVGSELRELVDLRLQLARLEIESDARAIKRLAAIVSAAAVLILTAMPLAASCAAEWLDGRLGIGRAGWLLWMALILLGSGGALGGVVWRRLRRGFTLLDQTRQELREDLVWMGEWLPKR